MEHEFSVDSVVEGVPVSAVSLHEAVREYREKCINIPDITRQLEESQANSGAWIGCVVGVYVSVFMKERVLAMGKGTPAYNVSCRSPMPEVFSTD